MDTSPLYPEALQKIGRNVVEFQKMEGMLKALLVSIEFDGEISELKTRISKRRDSVSKQTMGTVSKDLLEKMHSEPVEPSQTVNTGKHWISFQYRSGRSEEHIDRIKTSFGQFVEERNQLIHHRLLDLEPSSDDSCRKLISYLDAQRDRIEPLHDFVRQEMKAVDDMKVMAADILRQLNSRDTQSEST